MSSSKEQPQAAPSRSLPIIGVPALVLGAAVTYVAACSPVAWGMIVGSNVGLGGDIGRQWLMNLTEGLVAVGVIAGGRLLDRGKLLAVAGLGVIALGVGALIGWRSHGSPGAVLIGLGLLASFGAGVLMAQAVVTVIKKASAMRGLTIGFAYGLGVYAVELSWGSASMLSLSRGAGWVLSQVAWIGPLCGVLGGALLLLVNRTLRSDPVEGARRLPLIGPPPRTDSVSAHEHSAFLILIGLALLASFVGLMSQRAGAALSLQGLPEDSFASGVLVGHTFAACRAGGALLGGLLYDLLGPRLSGLIAGLSLAVTMIVLSFFSGYENPWHPLIGSIGLACGVGLAVVPVACRHLFGSEYFGKLFGFLYLSVALGNVAIIPLQSTVEANPQVSLWLCAALCVAVGLSALWLKAPPAEE